MARFLLHPYLLLSLAVLFWAGNSIVGRAFAQDIPPVALVFWRWTVAVVILTPLCLKAFRRDFPIIKRHWRYVMVQGAFSITAFNALLYWGLHHTNVVNTSLIQATMPVLTLIFSLWLLKKGVTRWAGFGVALSLCGVAWVVMRGDFQTLQTLTVNRGDLIILVAMMAWAIYTVLLNKMPAGISRMAITYGMVLSGLAFLTPLYVWEWTSFGGFELTEDTIWAFVYVGIFPSVLSLLCWNRGVELVGANVAGSFLNLMPLYGTGLAVLLLGERLYSYHWIGILLIFAGIYLVTRFK